MRMARLTPNFLLFLLIEPNLGETKESYKISKIKILGKLRNSIIEETESKEVETNDIEKLLNDVKDLMKPPN